MKIAIANNLVPFIYGGAEFLADSLRDRLIEYGHQAQIIRIPLKWHPSQKILEHMLACRLLKLDNIDRMIALKFPAYYLKHPNKVLWILHQFKQAYELWDTPYQDIPNSPEGSRIRSAVVGADNLFLKEAKSIYTISKEVSSRLNQYNRIESEVLYPPLKDADKYYTAECGDYLFYPSRINGAKRQHLAIEAMKHVRSGVKLLIAGRPDAPAELQRLEVLIGKNGLDHKVKIIGKWISDDKKRQLLANCLGCVFVPYNEDYGYVALEACYSQKPLITCTDSGGPLEFLDHEVTGLVVEPEPEQIAQAMDLLYSSKSSAVKLGQAGYEKVHALNISWHNIIGRLTE